MRDQLVNWPRLQRKAIKYANMKGYPSEANDFSQYYMVKLFLGSKGRIDQLWIDYLRKYFGRDSQSKTKILPKISFVEIQDWHVYEWPKDRVDWSRYIDVLSKREQKVLHYTLMGYSGKDISQMKEFNLSPSRIIQILNIICRKIRRHSVLNPKNKAHVD